MRRSQPFTRLFMIVFVIVFLFLFMSTASVVGAPFIVVLFAIGIVALALYRLLFK